MISDANEKAIFNALNHIYLHPHTYRYMSIGFPDNRHCKACLLGWIGYFMGMPPYNPSVGLNDVARHLGYISDIALYEDLKARFTTDECDYRKLEEATTLQPLYRWAEEL